MLEKTPPARQGKLIEVLLEIQRGGFHLIDTMSSQFASYANDFPLLEGLRLAWLFYAVLVAWAKWR